LVEEVVEKGDSLSALAALLAPIVWILSVVLEDRPASAG
jgi:hypothetical protein